MLLALLSADLDVVYHHTPKALEYNILEANPVRVGERLSHHS